MLNSSTLGGIVRTSLIAALAVAGGGWTLERVRFGASDAQAIARVGAETQQRFDASADKLGALTARAASQRELIRAAPRDAAAAARLFDALDAALAEDRGHTGITVYDAAGTPVAWAGLVADLPRPLDGPAALLVTAGALGPRLTRIEPVVDTDRRPATRLATVVAEQILEPIDRSPTLSDRFVLFTSLAPVTLRVGAVTPTASPAVFSITSRAGGALIDAEVAPGDLAAARAQWRRGTGAAVLSVSAVALLFCAGLLVEKRRRTNAVRTHLALSAGIVAALVLSRTLFRFATMQVEAARSLLGPLDLLLTSLVAAALAWLAIDLIESRWRARPRARLLAANAIGLVSVVYLTVGILDAALLWAYGRYLQSIISRTTVDLLHFSLHPFDSTRLELAFALVLLHAAVIWTAAALIRAPTLLWRLPRRRIPAVAAASWAVGALAAVMVAGARDPSIPSLPFVIALAAAGGCALSLPKLRVRARRVSQSMRIAGLFLALLIPAIAMYPSLSSFAIQAKERLIASEYGAQVIAQRDDLQQRLSRALKQIDGLAALPQLVTAPADEGATRAFRVWSQTELQKYRVTSAVELYGPDGRRVSRFALILPEVGTAPYRPAGCDWDLSDDVSPPRSSRTGANESHVLRASRGVCVDGRPLGGIIVRAMLDYRTLPFISSRSPYLESLRPDRDASAEGVSGRDVEFVLYGWSRAPLFASGTSVWTIPDAAFERMVDSRTRFWADVDRGNKRFRVYFMNDRGGIYALGYPVITAFGHLINLAELVTLAFALFVVLIAGATIFNTIFSHAPATGRALLREIRSSFYRKLRLAFVVGSVVPVIILALATHAYFANELNAGIEDAAARTATVAQRLVEDYAALQQRGSGGSGGLETLDDDIMMLVSRAIDEDVNLFDRTRLQATSALDLYASQLLSTRTPAEVYRRLYLERAPTYVGEQDVGAVRYLVAAAPVRTAGREGIVAVPVTLRPLEIEGQLDELDRRVLFGAVLFSLLGGALGYWMAERIADPVNRLTRATRRIARGDLDARIAATSADELGRLVRDFNQMAADLQRQRSELERTQRLEAWADMARQVAHDIKNPLTPIQLSAEHARRVNVDRGRPLSPVLDECITVILNQVRLLRQISSEFSSFASSPTPHPEPTALPALIDEVVSPYRMGLDRITIDVKAPDDLPMVNIDHTLFARALTNIIENALYAMPGKGALTMTVRLKPDATNVPEDATNVPAQAHVGSGFSRIIEVEIKDTGVGMDEEALGKMFEPYFSTKATGTGLGLTIAKRNIELNGGMIRVASERGAGTTVTLTLPV